MNCMHAAFPWGPVRHCHLLLLPLLKLLPNCLRFGGFGMITWSQHSSSKLSTLCQVYRLPNSLIISVYLMYVMYALMMKTRSTASKEGCHNAAVCHNPEGGRHFPQLWFRAPFDSHSPASSFLTRIANEMKLTVCSGCSVAMLHWGTLPTDLQLA